MTGSGARREATPSAQRRHRHRTAIGGPAGPLSRCGAKGASCAQLAT
nr:hypothetical protein RVX_0986 [Nitratidesulfovibrio sp. HK-II]